MTTGAVTRKRLECDLHAFRPSDPPDFRPPGEGGAPSPRAGASCRP